MFPPPSAWSLRVDLHPIYSSRVNSRSPGMANTVAQGRHLPNLCPGCGHVCIITQADLGCVGGAYFVTLLRASVMRRNPLSLPMLSGLATILAGIISVSLLAIRSFYDPALDVSAPRDLVLALLSGVYTAGVCLVVGPLLLLLTPLFAFHQSGRTRGWRA